MFYHNINLKYIYRILLEKILASYKTCRLNTKSNNIFIYKVNNAIIYNGQLLLLNKKDFEVTTLNINKVVYKENIK